MELTWLTVLASLALGLGAVCVFVFAIQRDYFHNLEDAKVQVFWSDLEEEERKGNGSPQGQGESAQR